MTNGVYENICRQEGHSIFDYDTAEYDLVCSRCGMTIEEIRGENQPVQRSIELPENTRLLYRGTIVKIGGLPVRLEDPVLASSKKWNLIGNVGKTSHRERK